MPINSTTPIINYVGNGVATSYAYPFKIFKVADLIVTIAGVVKAYGGDYSLTGVGVITGGNVLFSVAPANGTAVQIYRSVTYDRLTPDYQEGGDFLANTIDDDIDRVVAQVQQLSRDTGNFLRVPVGDLTNSLFPAIASRASKYPVFDSAGNVIVSSGTGSDPALRTDLAVSSGSSLVGFIQAGAGAVARTVQSKERETVSVTDFYANGVSGAAVDPTGVLDSTLGIQAAINSISLAGRIYLPPGIYKITSTLTIDGALRNVTLIGANGVRGVVAGGTRIDSASMLRWEGAVNQPILVMDSISGSTISRISFSTKSAVADTITTSGVEGIRFINKSSCRFSTIEHCEFYQLDIGVHFLDDGSGGSSNTNMDGHAVRDCVFSVCRTGVKINQTNVYDTEIAHCSFYGSTVYTQYHVWIVKGHCYVRSAYLGRLKDAASAGGKNGIALYVQTGQMNVTDAYAECDNGPFFVWEIAEPVATACAIVGCTILNATATLPGTYNLLNKTAESVVIIGGRIAGSVQQFSGTTGTITYIGTSTPAADAAGDTDRVQFYGLRSSFLGVIGTVGTGTATCHGTAPLLSLYDSGIGGAVELKHVANVATLNRPGLANGPRFEFSSTPVLNLQTNDWYLRLGTRNKGSTTLSAVAATTSVAATSILADSVVHLCPTTVAAANLIFSAAGPYISSKTAGVGFNVTTANGTNAPAGCTFDWLIQ